ncbi:ABC transporter [Nocardiopsis kunsanensis]|uniref:ABC transporter n=1 Tax=Nocardiopsis kunsanensis TaxID=141693 RepID=A0A919CG53_9ACTN|nr:metal ABC transporter ATP-binding protein [Nocardiopsis kunsanensis]GHD19697.1 ABC transporter [Nocardiopsis kunsanensis]
MNTPPAIHVTNTTVHYGHVLALDNIDLHVETGTTCALLGTNGSGKSTLFKTILGLTRPDHGHIRILGHTHNKARRSGLLTYMPQSEQVDWTFPLRVRDVIMMGRYGHMGPRRRPRPTDHQAVDQALEQTGLTQLAHRQIGALSGGQRKRAFLARALTQNADILLLDEPFAGVDKNSESTIIDLLLHMRALGHTLLISTHDLTQVPTLCDQALLLQRRVIAHGTPEQVLRPQTLMQAFENPTPQKGPTWTP